MADGWRSLKEIYESNEFKRYMEHGSIPVEQGDEYFVALNKIKKYYQYWEKDIIELGKRDLFRWHHSYPMGWHEIMTPIEFDAWGVIRSIGRIVLYPQYPVDKYYLDFANPYLKVGLEIDGKEFHDKCRDIVRDRALFDFGWKIFRITGSEMVKVFMGEKYEWESPEYSDEYLNYLQTSGEGVILAIRSMYFDGRGDYEFYKSILENHNLLGFEI